MAQILSVQTSDSIQNLNQSYKDDKTNEQRAAECALDKSEAALEPGACSGSLINYQGITRFPQSDLQGALDEVEAALRANACDARGYNNRGVLRQARGDFSGALADFNAALDHSPDYAEAYNNRGSLRLAQGEFATAVADFNQALRRTSRAAAAPVYHNRGTARHALGDLEGALSDFDCALAIDPRHAPTYTNRGTARHAVGDFEGARTDFDVALQLTPPDARALVHYHRGLLRISQGDVPGAIADYDRALRLDPRSFIVYIARANARYHKRDQAGFVDYLRAFGIDREGTARELVRILVLDLGRDSELVLTNCGKHLKLDPGDVTARCRRALTLVLLGREREAELDLEQILVRSPELKDVLGLLVQRAKDRQSGEHGAGQMEECRAVISECQDPSQTCDDLASQMCSPLLEGLNSCFASSGQE